MFRPKFLLPLLVFLTAAAVGCTQRPTAALGDTDRALDAKVAKLEKDLKTLQDEATKTRADAAKQVADAAKQVAAAAKQVADLGKERDELKLLLKARTGERDTLQAQYDGFRKDLKELLGKMDAASNIVAPSANTPAVTLLPAPTTVR